MVKEKYTSTIRVEFKELICNIVESERKTFHIYTIQRILSLGLLVDFTYKYIKLSNPEGSVGLELDLNKYGSVVFILDLDSNYVTLRRQRDREILEKFLEGFEVEMKKTKPHHRVF